MPFRTAARVVITNESSSNIDLLFYDIDFVKSAKPDPSALYFHAFWARQKTSAVGSDFEFLPAVNGRGRYLGVNMGVNADKRYETTWWGEGEVKLYMDNDAKFPSYNGTGTEDYIGTGWGLSAFTNMYQGATVANDSTKQYAFYRFHIPDQVFFNKNFRGTIQQIGGGERDLVERLGLRRAADQHGGENQSPRNRRKHGRASGCADNTKGVTTWRGEIAATIR